jgi:Domain of unknown function(DUF2779)
LKRPEQICFALAFSKNEPQTVAAMGRPGSTSAKQHSASGLERRPPLISKSSFLAGLQCRKLLWSQVNASDAIPAAEQQMLAVFDQGREVGLLVRRLYPDGIEVAPGVFEMNQVTTKTKRLLDLRRPLYEPGFIFNGCFARIDIFVPVGADAWDIVEVKSTTAVKDVHLADLAFQAYVAKGAGLRVRRLILAHVSGDYVRHGSVDPNLLFDLEDVISQALPLVKGIARQVSQMGSTTMRAKCPDVQIGPHCDDPYPCPLHDECWSFLPENSVFTLYRAGNKAFKLLSDGITHLVDIPSGFAMTDKQLIQRRALSSGTPHLRKAAVASFLRKLKYPVSFLDFETLATAVPLFDNVRPYQQVPFQFSLHIVRAPGGAPEHHPFLADGTGDPRPAFMQALCAALPETGSVVAYNADFEISRLQECAAVLPEHGPWVNAVKRRVIDLLQPFRNFDFYHPSQQGSCSMKATLPALTGVGYDHLDTRDGGMASSEFLRVTFGQVSAAEKAKVRQRLEEYCSLDTFGMLQIIDALRSMSASL